MGRLVPAGMAPKGRPTEHSVYVLDDRYLQHVITRDDTTVHVLLHDCHCGPVLVWVDWHAPQVAGLPLPEAVWVHRPLGDHG